MSLWRTSNDFCDVARVPRQLMAGVLGFSFEGASTVKRI